MDNFDSHYWKIIIIGYLLFDLLYVSMEGWGFYLYALAGLAMFILSDSLFEPTSTLDWLVKAIGVVFFAYAGYLRFRNRRR